MKDLNKICILSCMSLLMPGDIFETIDKAPFLLNVK
jgi:hypothetical protein